MVGDLDIRQYNPSDAERVLEVYELALRSHGWDFDEAIPPGQDITESFLGITEGYIDVGGEFLVGLIDDRINATGGFQPQDESTAEIRKMAVHPEHQQRGYGERMLVELEGRAEIRGFKRLVLETFERLTAARSLYEKYGYVETHREHDEKFGQDRVYYRKDL